MKNLRSFSSKSILITWNSRALARPLFTRVVRFLSWRAKALWLRRKIITSGRESNLLQGSPLSLSISSPWRPVTYALCRPRLTRCFSPTRLRLFPNRTAGAIRTYWTQRMKTLIKSLKRIGMSSKKSSHFQKPTPFLKKKISIHFKSAHKRSFSRTSTWLDQRSAAFPSLDSSQTMDLWL